MLCRHNCYIIHNMAAVALYPVQLCTAFYCTLCLRHSLAFATITSYEFSLTNLPYYPPPERQAHWCPIFGTVMHKWKPLVCHSILMDSMSLVIGFRQNVGNSCGINRKTLHEYLSYISGNKPLYSIICL